MDRMKKQAFVALAVFIALVNAIVFTKALFDRSEQRRTLVLSERELNFAYASEPENSGVNLRIKYRVPNSEDDPSNSWRKAPPWLTLAKMRTLGFSERELNTAKSLGHKPKMSKEVYVALEFNGAEHKRRVALLKDKLERLEADEKVTSKDLERPKNRLHRAQFYDSRLFVIDAELHLETLVQRYAIRGDVVFAKAIVVRTHSESNDKNEPAGRIESLSVAELNVPYPFNQILLGLKQTSVSDHSHSHGSGEGKIVFAAKVTYGAGFQPQIVEIIEPKVKSFSPLNGV